MPFPRLTWATCECCGWEGEDEVTQFLVEEAVMSAFQLWQAREQERAFEETARAERLEAAARRAIGR